MAEWRQYFRGLPTGPDVRKLEKAYPDMKQLRGTTIPHEQLELILGITRENEPHRYKTVLKRWRDQVRLRTGVVIRGDLTEVIGVGLRVLTDAEQIKFGVFERQGAGRKIRSSHAAFADTDETQLTPEDRREREHGLLAGKMLHTAFVESRKRLIEAPRPPEQQPKPGTQS